MALTSNSTVTFGYLLGAQYEVPYCEITSCDQQQIKGDDERTVVGVRTTLECRGMFASAAAYDDFRKSVVGSKKANASVLRFEAKTRQPGGGWHTFVKWDGTVTDDIGGPFMTMKATEVIGQNAVLVSFTFVTQSTRPIDFATGDAGTPVPVVANTWRQQMRVGPAGLLQRVVHGKIVCAPGTWDGTADFNANAKPVDSTTSTQWRAKAPFPDLFRYAVAPPVPGYGWRRTVQEYVLTPDGASMTYQLVDEQGMHDLPYPAQAGSFEFEFNRALDDAGMANTRGVIELSGGADLNPRQLVAAAFDLAAARINPARDLILALTVRENDIMASPSITVEIEARLWSNNTANTLTIPLSTMIGAEFEVVRPICSRTVPPYGSGQRFSDGEDPTIESWWMQPAWLYAELSYQTQYDDAPDMATAAVHRFVCKECSGAIDIIIAPTNTHVDEMNEALFGEDSHQPYPGQYPKQTDATVEPGAGCPTTMLESYAHTRIVSKPRVRRCSVAYLQAADYRFQVAKPVVYEVEKVVVSRMNQNPPKPMRPLPAGCVVRAEKWEIEPGRGDPVGNRLYRGVYYRRIELCDLGGATSTNGFSTVSIGGQTFRAWGPAAGKVLGPLLPSLSADTQASALSTLPVVADVLDDTKLAAAVTSSPVVST